MWENFTSCSFTNQAMSYSQLLTLATTCHSLSYVQLKILVTSCHQLKIFTITCHICYHCYFVECECNNHADACVYNRTLGHGVCLDCRDNTIGPFCNTCADGFYSNSTLPLNSTDICIGILHTPFLTMPNLTIRNLTYCIYLNFTYMCLRYKLNGKSKTYSWLFLIVSYYFSTILTVSHCFSLFLIVSHYFSLFSNNSHCFSLFLANSHCFSLLLTISHCFPIILTVSHYSLTILTISHYFSLFPNNSHCFSLFLDNSHYFSLFLTANCHCVA